MTTENRLKWSDWTKGEYPSTHAYLNNFFAMIRVLVPGEIHGWGNRAWSVTYDGKEVASGFSYGTTQSEEACEFILRQSGAFEEVENVDGADAGSV